MSRPYKREYQIENRVVGLRASSGVGALGPNGRWRKGPFLWLSVRDHTGEVTAHCTRAEVTRIRDALARWLEIGP